MQTRLNSLVEQLLNVGSGFVLAMFIQQLVITPLWGLQTSIADNLAITTVFTVVSVARGYGWRRFFNHRLNKNNEKAAHESDCHNGARAPR